MTALAQGTAGLALVMASALLCIRQIRPAAMLLAIQSAAVAVAALVLQQPVMAIPPLLLAAGICFAARPAATTDPSTPSSPSWPSRKEASPCRWPLSCCPSCSPPQDAMR
jgi:hypothetical protein